MIAVIVLDVVLAPPSASGDPWDAPSRQVWGSGTELVSVDVPGVDAGFNSRGNAVSADGRYVAFASVVKWDPDDDNNRWDIYLRDRAEGTTVLISRGLDGTAGDEHSDAPSISADGRYVVFYSSASDLVVAAEPHPVGQYDIYRHDTQTGVTELVSVARNGGWGNGQSIEQSLSASGELVAFTSTSSNLVSHDTNSKRDVFRRDMVRGTTERVSVSYTGEQLARPSLEPSISGSGTLVAFVSYDSAVVRVDDDRRRDVFVRDLVEETNSAVSVTSDEAPVVRASAYPTFSGNGRCVAFESDAPGLTGRNRLDTVDIFVRDLVKGSTRLVSRSSSGNPGNDDSHGASINQTCRLVAFNSGATNLVPLMSHPYAGHVYVRNLDRRTTRWVSVPYDPSLSLKLYAYGAHISADGSVVAFDSSWKSLVPGDVDQSEDVFVRRR